MPGIIDYGSIINMIVNVLQSKVAPGTPCKGASIQSDTPVRAVADEAMIPADFVGKLGPMI